MLAEIRLASFDPWREIGDYEKRHRIMQGVCGATAVFVGSSRDHNEGRSVAGLFLDYYPRMTEAYLNRLCDEAAEKWPIQHALVLHRVGEIAVGETIVLVATWSAHRAAALEACRYLIEELKHRAPFWKKETLATGEALWVERNTPR